MNKTILNTEVQDFINAHLESDIASLILRGSPFETLSIQDIVKQIQAKKKSKLKLPTWFKTKGIYYPNKLNIEQTSSEIAAEYKAHLINGNSLIDITGGFGVDAYYFSKYVESVIHCEVNQTLSKIAQHNFQKLGADTIQCIQKDGIDVLKSENRQYDCVYVDPSRRDDLKQKVFLLSDCTPNLVTFKHLFLKYAPKVMVKTSPLLDISKTIEDLELVTEVHIVSVFNEVKELIFILEREPQNKTLIKTINIHKADTQYFDFSFEEETISEATFSNPLTYIYEPNTSILKAGAFKSISEKLGVYKLHKHSHLYTSDLLMDFPGRRFKIITQLPFNKKQFSKLKILRANITTRNFPLGVHDLKKKLNIKDGGDYYLFFTTNYTNDKIILVTSKV